MKQLLSCEDLSRSFRDSRGVRKVLDGVSFTLGRGELLAISGNSGAGKSTLVHCVSGLLGLERGRVLFCGRDLQTLRGSARDRLRSSEIAVIFQSFHLLSHLNVRENLLLPGLFSGRHHGSSEIAAILRRVGLAGFERAMPRDLSGGERQRVAVARALLQGAKLLLCDEITANLDAGTAEDILQLLRRILAEGQTGILAVSHHPSMLEMADSHLRLEKGLLGPAP